MHGFILTEIEKYATTKLGAEAWKAVLDQSKIGPKSYENFRSYPDEEVVALVSTASSLTGMSVPALLEDFGQFLGGDLLRIYRPLINPEWKTLDFLENIEETIHKVVRSRNAAKPPALVFQRTSPNEVVLVYRSPRKLCALATGIAKGVASSYGEELRVEETSCMNNGGSECRIAFQLQVPVPRLL